MAAFQQGFFDWATYTAPKMLTTPVISYVDIGDRIRLANGQQGKTAPRLAAPTALQDGSFGTSK
jgi:hypothetical protein